MRSVGITLLLGVSLLVFSGCFGYRLVRPEEVEVPSYEPRPVAVPAECDALIERAAVEGVRRLAEDEARMLSFCQNQQIIRAQEEEAAYRKLEAHSAAANFILRATVVGIGALIAVLTWMF